MKNKKRPALGLVMMTVLLLCACGTVSDDIEETVQAAAIEVSAQEASWEQWYGDAVIEEELDLYSECVIAADLDTGQIIYSANEDQSVIPASTVKLLTCLIAAESCSLDETVTFSESALALNSTDSNIGAKAGEQMSLKDALYGMMLPSGCDAANAVAEHVAGSIEAFVELMNEYAASLGCENTHFENPSGIDDWANYTTAADMLLIAKACFSNETVLEIVSTLSYTAAATNLSDERSYTNSNLLMDPDTEFYDGRVIGGKTGMTAESTRCLVVLAKVSGHRIVCVLYDCPDRTGVFPDVTAILDNI